MSDAFLGGLSEIELAIVDAVRKWVDKEVITSAHDLVPTLCDLTPADLPDKNFAGRSYLPLLQNKPLPKKLVKKLLDVRMAEAFGPRR